MKISAVIIGAIGLAAGLSVGLSLGFSYAGTDAGGPAISFEQPAGSMVPSGTVNIGLVVPLTGEISTIGNDNEMAARLAVEDFNLYLDKIGAGWEFNLVVEDSQADPIVALEKVQSLNSKGIQLVLGPDSSTELRNVKSYTGSNGMLLISSTSTTPTLSIDDNIFRLVPDDTQQGRAIATLAESRGITTLIPVHRGDVWGDGLYESTKTWFEARGGTFDEGIRYSPENSVFSIEAYLLSERLAGYLQERPASEVAIVMMTFEEGVHIFQSASSYDELRSVLWIGTDTLSNNGLLVEDSITAGFLSDVDFVSGQFAVSENDHYNRVKGILTDRMGSSPANYAYPTYDSVWLIGLGILQLQTTDSELLIEALPMVASHYSGALGAVILNDAGDLAISDYGLFAVRDGKWVDYGLYDARTDTVIVR
ncbi:ABC-type branched-chain amino acid transport system, periplasmic component [Cenarchaeum symbiosum A]|uniref:ABC-type branched-chain amino acid transport system, periplasmic component n=1 Tax=Cenarchaeum symbiosum (strain A) TaxID=414004 RepID=A0RUV0_CENSY|nr:ABC-type branched-chain amino acid transport system, periplasmic component [Cenarchaeum symbiosum A]